MADTFRTLAAPAQSKYTEKMSRFLAFAFPVSTVAEAKEAIARVRNEYHDARHVCWAYMVGPQRDTYLSSDDGEPSGTAGKPILGQINSFELTDVAVAVVRYFGGIKLGTSGLIQAYRQATREAFEGAQIIEKRQMARLLVDFSYLQMNDVMRAVKQSAAAIVAQQFDNACSLTLEIPLDDAPALAARLADVATVEVSS